MGNTQVPRRAAREMADTFAGVALEMPDDEKLTFQQLAGRLSSTFNGRPSHHDTHLPRGDCSLREYVTKGDMLCTAAGCSAIARGMGERDSLNFAEFGSRLQVRRTRDTAGGDVSDWLLALLRNWRAPDPGDSPPDYNDSADEDSDDDDLG